MPGVTPNRNVMPADVWMRSFGLDQWGALGLLWIGDYVHHYTAYLCPAGEYRKILLTTSWPNGQPATDTNPGIYGAYVIETDYMLRNLYRNTDKPMLEDHMGKVAVFDSASGTRLRHRDGFNAGFFDGHVRWWADTTGEFYWMWWDPAGNGGLINSRTTTLFNEWDR